MKRVVGRAMIGAVVLVSAVASARALDDAHRQKADGAVGRGITYLRAQQNDNGSWSPDAGPAITALAVTVMLDRPGISIQDTAVSQGIDYILSKVPLHFKSLNYIRGRSFQYSLIIIDESQNLTPHQIKTIITRAGTGSKVICLGNLAQIDTPYLTKTTSGLTYVVDRFRDWDHSGHITLTQGERSRLADYANEYL
jgi:predicted ribonuclease YlaK